MEKLYAKLADILDVETVQDENVLADFEDWDSLAILTLISFLDKEFHVNLYTNEIKKLNTVADLIDLINSKKA